MRRVRVSCLLLAALAATIAVASGAPGTAEAGGRVFVNCEAFERGVFVFHASVQPSSCTLQGVPPVGYKDWILSGLRWSGWGTSIAVATGLYHYRHGEYKDGKLVYPVVPTKVVLSRIRTGCDGRRYYTSASEGEQTKRLSDSCTPG